MKNSVSQLPVFKNASAFLPRRAYVRSTFLTEE